MAYSVLMCCKCIQAILTTLFVGIIIITTIIIIIYYTPRGPDRLKKLSKPHIYFYPSSLAQSLTQYLILSVTWEERVRWPAASSTDKPIPMEGPHRES